MNEKEKLNELIRGMNDVITTLAAQEESIKTLQTALTQREKAIEDAQKQTEDVKRQAEAEKKQEETMKKMIEKILAKPSTTEPTPPTVP